MGFNEVDCVVNEAWCEFFKYLRDRGFQVSKMEACMDQKDCFYAVLSCAMQFAPKGEDKDE